MNLNVVLKFRTDRQSLVVELISSHVQCCNYFSKKKKGIIEPKKDSAFSFYWLNQSVWSKLFKIQSSLTLKINWCLSLSVYPHTPKNKKIERPVNQTFPTNSPTPTVPHSFSSPWRGARSSPELAVKFSRSHSSSSIPFCLVA